MTKKNVVKFPVAKAAPLDPADRRFAANLRLLDPRTRRALSDAINRLAAGEPGQIVFTELFIELGYPPALARQKAREAGYSCSPHPNGSGA